MALIEFKNLPDTSTPLSAENLNHNFNELNNRDVYSSEEVVIGKDENGKNVYKRTFIGKLGDYGHTTFSKGYNNNTIRIKKAYGHLRSSSGAVNLGSYVTENFFSGVYVHAEELQVYYGASLKNGTYDITLEFTKTTD